ncbi:MAG TPA: YwiC-like family protein [Thermoflexales bacterium]|nr:YwiC-like family protein [Anaerolineae bacterium]HQV28768.1 YwiC-like family protein [Thermoflexales bacterium]HQX11475.1 YwiC-like family protein [Thermoflexales bacterium]HQY25418.1 YwiC-like family protein [Thermoflexales bacterium]HQZ53817.1 YwiC-like family protein [Thermoflexales bacterium]
MNGLFRRQIALPQDHGSWVFIGMPLLIGLFDGGIIAPASVALVIAAMAAFLIRQPVTMAIKVESGRRPRTDLPAALFWLAVYGLIAALAAVALIALGAGSVLYLALPAAPIFAWHLLLVSRRAERRQLWIEVLGTGALALAAPAAYWVGIGRYESGGLLLWGLVWAQSAASIAYAYFRLEQREWKVVPDRRARFAAGRGPILFAGANLLGAVVLGPLTGLQPGWVFVPFALQFAETLWGTDHPAIGARPAAIGTRQLVVSTLFTLLFIVAIQR